MDPSTLDVLRSCAGLDAALLTALGNLSKVSRITLDELDAALTDYVRNIDPNAVLTEEDLAPVTAAVDARDAVRKELARRPDPVAQMTALRARILGDAPASTPAAPSRPARQAAKRPAIFRPRGAPAASRSALTVTAASGRPLADARELAEEFGARLSDLRSVPGDGKHRVARLAVEYPEDRRLGGDPVANQALVAAVAGPDALVASGGLCAPTDVRYEMLGLSTDARPVRDALPGFAADRGGVRYIVPPSLAGVSDGVELWTEAIDAAPGGATKNVHVIACGEEVEVLVSAITKRLQFGNFNARYFPELIEANLSLLTAAQSRLAEQTLLAAMVTASTAVTSGQTLGTARDVLSDVDRAVAGLRARHRLSEDQAVRFIAPSWLRGMIRVDLMREQPGAAAERMAVADAEIASFFAARYVVPTWSLDWQISTLGGTQGVGSLTGWPSTVQSLIYPEGSFLFLDGGVLDLGLVRDSTLNSTNDAEWFAEVFENVAFIGSESLALTSDICSDGTTSAPQTILPCLTGS